VRRVVVGLQSLDYDILKARPTVPRNKKAALFIRCTEEEAEKIRRTARAERRTVSGFILNAVFHRIAMRERLLAEHEPEAKPKAPAREA
jgi:Protein of unknown function (DUF1778)